MNPDQIIAQFICAAVGALLIPLACTSDFDLKRWQRCLLFTAGALLAAPGALNLYLTAVLG